MISPLLGLIAVRFAFGIGTLFAVSLLIFIGTEILPGDVAEAVLGQGATPETVASLRQQLGLDLPAYVRYFDWLGAALQGDFGTSLTSRQPIVEMVGARLTNTLLLAGVSALISVPLAISLGLVAARYRESWIDRSISTSTLLAISMPEFFVGYILIFIFAVKLRWFPSLANISPSMSLGDQLYAIVLPCLSLILVVVAHMLRMTRASIISVMSSPYIEMAELKGLSHTRIVVWHAFPNALSPIITIVLLNLAYLVVGIVVIEVVFVYPGLGQMMVDHVVKRDVPVIQACGLIFAGTYVILNTMADILSNLANPRLRHPR